MLVVVDSNVFAKALFEDNEWCQRILDLESHGVIKFVFNDLTAIEIVCVISELLAKKSANKQFTYWAQGKVLRIILRSKIVPHITSCNICEDKNDNKFIDCAIDSKAEYIISENGQHLYSGLESEIKKQHSYNVRILSAFQFITGVILQQKLS